MGKQISDKDNSILNASLHITPEEFDEAKMKAYKDNSERYPVPGFAQGMAQLADLQQIYGPAVLYDEALNIKVPELFSRYLQENHIKIMGAPTVESVSYDADGGVSFTVKADRFPDVKLGQYRGISVPFAREDKANFELEALRRACEQIEGYVPRHMVDQKLDQMMAQEKLRANGDSIYHLLADTVALLKKAYALVGISRPDAEVRADSMDIMLQSVSFENQEMPESFLVQQIVDQTGRYRKVPDDFTDQVNALVQERVKEKSEMKPEEMTEEIFKAYLGALKLDSEKDWREQRSMQAAQEAAFDILYENVAEEEKLTVTADELHQAYEDLASRYGVELDDIIANVDKELVTRDLIRQKARQLIIDSAVSEVPESSGQAAAEA